MSEDAESSTLWADAVAEYESQTERKIAKDSAFSDLKSLRDLDRAMDRQSDRFGQFRNEHRKVYSALAKSIAPLQSILDLVQRGIGNSPYAPASAVLGAASYLLQACRSVSKAYDGIERLFEEMRDITVRLEQYESGGIDDPLRSKMTTILSLFLETIGRAEACIKRKRFKQWARNVFLQDDGIFSSLERLRKYVELESGLVIALTYRGVKDVRTDVRDVKSEFKEVKVELKEMKTATLNSQRNDNRRKEDKILSDLLKTRTTDEISQKHIDDKEKLTEGTAMWMGDVPMFQAWEREEFPILWIFGKPGVGKTMLAARTIELLHIKFPQHLDLPSLTSVGYIYFKEDNPLFHNCAQMWKTAAFQLMNADDRLRKHLLTTIEKKQDTFASAMHIWQQLFLDFFIDDPIQQSSVSRCYLIVDGLDEAPEVERREFLRCLARLVNPDGKNRRYRIQVAVFSRPDLRRDLLEVGFPSQENVVRVTPDRSNTDIEAYIRQGLSDVPVLRLLKKRYANRERQRLAKEIYESIKTGSQGMFLWARLVFDQLRIPRSLEGVKEVLQGAPEGLDDMLFHVFERLDESSQPSYLKHMISWVLCAHRPLNLSELYVLLIISTNEHFYGIDEDLKERYSSLFDLKGASAEQKEERDENEGDEDADEQDDFGFLDDESDIGPDEEHGINPFDVEALRLDSSTVSTIAGVQFDDLEIPSDWYESTVAFSHARIREYLLAEGNPSTRKRPICTVVPADLNLTQLSIFNDLYQALSGEVPVKHSTSSLKQYAQIYWYKHLVDIDFDKLSKEETVRVARMLLSLFRNGSKMLDICSENFDASNVSTLVRSEFVTAWFGTDRYSSIVRNLLQDSIDDLEETDREWAISAGNSARNLFQPLIAACARRWLAKGSWDDANYLLYDDENAWLIYMYSTLTDEGTNEAAEDRMSNYNSYIPLDSLEAIAQLEPCSKDAHYYTGIGCVAILQNDFEKGVELFKQALQLDPDAWLTLAELSKCYGDQQNQYLDAISTMEESIRKLPSKREFEGLDLCYMARVVGWKLQLGRDDASLKAAEQLYHLCKPLLYGGATWRRDVGILRSIKHYTEALYGREMFEQMFELFQELDLIKTKDGDASLWIKFLKSQIYGDYDVFIFSKIPIMSQHLGKPEFSEFVDGSIEKLFDFDIQKVNVFEQIWLGSAAAEWQYKYAMHPHTHIWEKVIQWVDSGEESVQQYYYYQRDRASTFLSILYFNQALSLPRDDGSNSVALKRLEELALHKQGSVEHYRASHSSLLRGAWLREYGDTKEEAWRSCIRPTIKQTLYYLHDSDPLNDQMAYAELGQALLCAGDIPNASIAFGIALKSLEAESETSKLEKSKSEVGDEAKKETATASADEDTYEATTSLDQDSKDESTQVDRVLPKDPNQINTAKDSEVVPYKPTNKIEDNGIDTGAEPTVRKAEVAEIQDNPKYTGFDSSWSCDGPCERQRVEYEELHFCRYCQYVCFCEKCIELAKTDAMPYRYCSPKHDWVRMYPITDTAQRLVDALMTRNDEIQEEWLGELKKTWNID